MVVRVGGLRGGGGGGVNPTSSLQVWLSHMAADHIWQTGLSTAQL